jgi:hypothetical protein
VTRCMIALFLVGAVWATPAIASKKHDYGVAQIVGHVQFDDSTLLDMGSQPAPGDSVCMFSTRMTGRERLRFY